MGLFGNNRDSFIGSTTLTWEDNEKRNNVMWKVPRNIKFFDQLVVREDEISVFYKDGKALAYIDRPDRYALTSLDAPIIGPILKAIGGIKQPAEVFYIQKRQFDGKFGSKQPYVFRDKEFGLVNLRVFGEYRYKVSLPANFINQFVGTLNCQTAMEVEERLKEQIVLVLYDVIGDLKNKGIGVADLASNLTNIEQVFLERAKSHYEPYGVSIEKVSGLYITMPEEVQKAVDTRSSMSVLGTNYMQYQAGQAMREAATNPSGGAAGAGVGVGAGIGLGYAMIGQMQQAGQQPAPGAVPPAVAPATPVQGTPCTKCGASMPAGSKFCPSCGAKQEQALCPKCGASLPAGSKFCPSCGEKVGERTCAKCNAKIPAGSKFCPECGAPVG
jgi:membrane protease subunit (stomatin/prohibitin family)